jgi:uncharacterized protein (TIGR03067 family)
MKTNLAVAAFVVVLVLCGGCASTSSHGLSRLQGTWIGHEIDGRSGECRMTISGDSLKFQGAQQEWYDAKLALIPRTSPNQADVLVKDCPAPQYIQKTAKAVYKLEGKTLTIAAHEPGDETLPTGFEKDNRTRIFVFSRL